MDAIWIWTLDLETDLDFGFIFFVRLNYGLTFNVIKASTVRVDWKWIRSGKGIFLVLCISTRNHLGLAFRS